MTRLSDYRKRALDEVRDLADQAQGYLDYAGTISSPPANHGGEWDWFFELARPERQRLLKRWTQANSNGPDHLENVEEWLRCTRVVDCAAMVGKRPGLDYLPSVGGSANEILRTSFDLVRLFGNDSAGYLESLGEIHDEDERWGWIAELAMQAEYQEIDEPAGLDWNGPPVAGLAEIAAVTGKPIRNVYSWHKRGTLPKPDVELKAGPVWYAETLQGWMTSRPRVLRNA